MKQVRVASRYAKALLELAQEQNKADVVMNDMQLLLNTLNSHSELNSLMNNPIVSQAKKKSIFSEIFSSKIDSLTFSFLDLVLQKRRENNFVAVADSFIEQYNQQNGITKVEITTAIPLTDDLESKILEQIKSTSNIQSIDLKKSVDPSIIGGYIVEFNNRVLDKSVQTNLNTIKRRFNAN